MKTIVMGKKIKRNYELKAESDDNGKLKYKPYIKELDPDIQWEEICSYEGEARCCSNTDPFKIDFNHYIYLSEDEKVIVEKEIFRADLGDYIQYTNKVLEEDKSDEPDIEIYIKDYNKQMIEADSEAKAYCDLHKLNYEDTDYDELMKYINPNKDIYPNKVLNIELDPTSIMIKPIIPF